MKKAYKGAAVLLLSAAVLGLTAFKIAEVTCVSPDIPARPQSEAPASYSVYAPYGLHFNEAKNELMFEKELVRYFYDGVDLGDGMAAVRCDYLNENGAVDVHTVREPAANGDGSIDPFGKLLGIERYSQEEFDQRDFLDFYGPSEPVAYAVGSDDPTAKSFSDRFAPYKAFGIEYVEAQSVSGRGNVYYNGQLVDTFIDITPADGVFSFQSADGGGIKVQTVYDPDGALTGVQALRR